MNSNIESVRKRLRLLRNHWTRLYTNLSNENGEYAGKIKGLCPERDSCPQCREARMADPGYQWYLRRKWFLETLKSRGKTLSDLESRADSESLQEGILLETELMYEQGFKAYHELISK